MKSSQLKTMVGKVLEEFPDTRNSDVALMIEVWKKYYPAMVRQGSGGQWGVWLRDLYDLPREDNVKRYRAYYQNERGLYLPGSAEVAKQRRINEQYWLSEMSNNSIYKRI